MFLSRRAKSTRHTVPVPGSIEGLDEAEGWALLESLGHEVFLELHDGERVGFTELWEDFREDPQGVTEPALRPAVASGITMSSALAYILPVAAWLLKIATERVAGQAVDALGSITREKIKRLLRNRRPQPPAGEPAADFLPVSLDPEEEQAALASLAAWAQSIGATAGQAHEVAETIMRVLRGNEEGSR